MSPDPRINKALRTAQCQTQKTKQRKQKRFSEPAFSQADDLSNPAETSVGLLLVTQFKRRNIRSRRGAHWPTQATASLDGVAKGTSQAVSELGCFCLIRFSLCAMDARLCFRCPHDLHGTPACPPALFNTATAKPTPRKCPPDARRKGPSEPPALANEGAMAPCSGKLPHEKNSDGCIVAVVHSVALAFRKISITVEDRMTA